MLIIFRVNIKINLLLVFQSHLKIVLGENKKTSLKEIK